MVHVFEGLHEPDLQQVTRISVLPPKSQRQEGGFRSDVHPVVDARGMVEVEPEPAAGIHRRRSAATVMAPSGKKTGTGRRGIAEITIHDQRDDTGAPMASGEIRPGLRSLERSGSVAIVLAGIVEVVHRGAPLQLCTEATELVAAGRRAAADSATVEDGPDLGMVVNGGRGNSHVVRAEDWAASEVRIGVHRLVVDIGERDIVPDRHCVSVRFVAQLRPFGG